MVTRNGVQFGWETIEDMYVRDTQRAREGLPRMQSSWNARILCVQRHLVKIKCKTCKDHASECIYLIPKYVVPNSVHAILQ